MDWEMDKDFPLALSGSRSYISGQKNYEIPIIVFVQPLIDRLNNRFTREDEYDRNYAR